MSPYHPKRPCGQTGCPVIIAHGHTYCKEHTPPAPHREGSTAAGYGYRWQKLRKMLLARQPMCGTLACNQPSVDVHHIIPKKEGGTDSIKNLQGLCKSCHSKETNKEMAR